MSLLLLLVVRSVEQQMVSWVIKIEVLGFTQVNGDLLGGLIVWMQPNCLMGFSDTPQAVCCLRTGSHALIYQYHSSFFTPPEPLVLFCSSVSESLNLHCY